ncbi:MAG: hypothetical protein FMNOHCHN_03421 [Ignavibacteriaceae bacterium]|nr:hypothetical protein [Ignavibacteriaceae bacterium]
MSEYQLYNVEVTFRTVIRAKSEIEALNEAPSVVKQEDDPPQDVYAFIIKDLGDLPDGWSGRCLPWGERHPMDLTIAEQLKELKK